MLPKLDEFFEWYFHTETTNIPHFKDVYPPGDTSILEEEEEEVTVEDMILHDIQNQDDVFDIGTIDFND